MIILLALIKAILTLGVSAALLWSILFCIKKNNYIVLYIGVGIIFLLQLTLIYLR